MTRGRMVLPLLVIVLAMCTHEGLCLKCWDCTSEYDSHCGDPFDNTTIPLTDCDLKRELPHLPAGTRSSFCRKVRQQVNGHVKIFRGCGFLKESGFGNREKSCFLRSGGDKIVMEYCTCDKPGCNTSATIYSNQLMIVFISILTYLASHL